MTNTQKRTEMVKGLGFTKDLTSGVIEVLKSKSTKANEQVLNQMSVSDFYIILSDGRQFTIHSHYHVNKYEINRIAKIVGLDYIKCGTLIDDNGLWLDWVKLA
jgi:predicted glycosyltransferase